LSPGDFGIACEVIRRRTGLIARQLNIKNKAVNGSMEVRHMSLENASPPGAEGGLHAARHAIESLLAYRLWGASRAGKHDAAAARIFDIGGGWAALRKSAGGRFDT